MIVTHNKVVLHDFYIWRWSPICVARRFVRNPPPKIDISVRQLYSFTFGSQVWREFLHEISQSLRTATTFVSHWWTSKLAQWFVQTVSISKIRSESYRGHTLVWVRSRSTERHIGNRKAESPPSQLIVPPDDDSTPLHSDGPWNQPNDWYHSISPEIVHILSTTKFAAKMSDLCPRNSAEGSHWQWLPSSIVRVSDSNWTRVSQTTSVSFLWDALDSKSRQQSVGFGVGINAERRRWRAD